MGLLQNNAAVFLSSNAVFRAVFNQNWYQKQQLANLLSVLTKKDKQMENSSLKHSELAILLPLLLETDKGMAN